MHRPGPALRGAAAPSKPALYRHRRAVAGHRHRRDHLGIHRRQRAAAAGGGRRERSRAPRRHCPAHPGAGPRRRADVVPGRQRPAPAADHGLRGLRLPAEHGVSGPPIRGSRGPRRGQPRHLELLPGARRAAGCRQVVRHRRRRAGRGQPGDRAQSSILDAALQWRRRRDRPYGASQRRSTHRHRCRGRDVSRVERCRTRRVAAGLDGGCRLAGREWCRADEPRDPLAQRRRSTADRRFARAGVRADRGGGSGAPAQRADGRVQGPARRQGTRPQCVCLERRDGVADSLRSAWPHRRVPGPADGARRPRARHRLRESGRGPAGAGDEPPPRDCRPHSRRGCAPALDPAAADRDDAALRVGGHRRVGCRPADHALDGVAPSALPV